jgi:hypothetical protein
VKGIGKLYSFSAIFPPFYIKNKKNLSILLKQARRCHFKKPTSRWIPRHI